MLRNLLLVLVSLSAVYGQGITGQISGTVVDETGAVVPGALVQLRYDLTNQLHTFTAEANGSFMFTNLVPGEYSVHIAQAGFKGYDQKSIMLSAQERIDLHDIKLSVGDVG